MHTKKKILSVENLSEDTQKLFNVLNEESDLAVILVAASYIDTALATSFSAFCAPVRLPTVSLIQSVETRRCSQRLRRRWFFHVQRS